MSPVILEFLIFCWSLTTQHHGELGSFFCLISTTTDPRVIEEYEKELAILLEQKSYQPRDEKGRFTSSSQPTPIQAPLEPGKDILIEKLRVPGENVIKAFEDEGCKFGISKFLMYTMSRIFLQRFKDNTNLIL